MHPRFPPPPRGLPIGQPGVGFLLTKYQCYRPRDYVFRAWRWSVYIGGFGIVHGLQLCCAKWRRSGTIRVPAWKSAGGECRRGWRVESSRVEEERRPRLGKGSVSRKARSNDVCLAFEKRETAALGVAEDTGFGTEMMAKGRQRPCPCSFPRRASPQHPLSSKLRSCLSRSRSLLHPSLGFLSLSLSPSAYLSISVSALPSSAAVSAGASPVVVTLRPLPSSFSRRSRSSPRKLKLPCVGVRASGAP